MVLRNFPKAVTLADEGSTKSLSHILHFYNQDASLARSFHNPEWISNQTSTFEGEQRCTVASRELWKRAMSSRESGAQTSSWLSRAAENVALAMARRCEAAMLKGDERC